ncbi:carboxymuconolactone decarboxylase family protein [Nereida sp. MMG025]|uniref:carboxymuconolactone decarboxylase family protein n=1 Tax=Nereida sp. MMG025 TaxID=2909981 RepID=UPI001F1EB8C6|nr:carboxymuconolactone decarboxylase family protein [Nereida sp. MMG025]MCF6445308.1 carboxymuconolactone decarboxylase family protein [Nereida sp. MMG025]
MNVTPNPYEAMMRQAQEMVKSVNPALESFMPKGFEDLFTPSKDMLEATMGKTFNPDGLDAKTRLLITLAGLVAQGAQAEPQITLTVKNAAEAGATKQEIIETIATMSLLGGVPAMSNAMQLAEAALTPKDATT